MGVLDSFLTFSVFIEPTEPISTSILTVKNSVYTLAIRETQKKSKILYNKKYFMTRYQKSLWHYDDVVLTFPLKKRFLL